MKRPGPEDQTRTGDSPVRGRALAGALLVCLLAGACAVVEAPPGGPPDLTAPRLAAVTPDSGAVALGEVRTLRLTFTEKMTRQPAEGWLHFYPAQRIRSTNWHGAREAEVELFEPLPADTVVVVEIAGALQDAHKVKARESRRSASSSTSGRLQNAQRTYGRPASGSSWNTSCGIATTPARCGRSRQNAQPSAYPRGRTSVVAK